jgi:hypothetical protein
VLLKIGLRLGRQSTTHIVVVLKYKTRPRFGRNDPGDSRLQRTNNLLSLLFKTSLAGRFGRRTFPVAWFRKCRVELDQNPLSSSRHDDGELVADPIWKWPSSPDRYLDTPLRLELSANPNVRLVDAASAPALAATLLACPSNPPGERGWSGQSSSVSPGAIAQCARRW